MATGVKVANQSLLCGKLQAMVTAWHWWKSLYSQRSPQCGYQCNSFNNQIYGLTKDSTRQLPKKGYITKSSPFGTIERPFRPAELTFGARGYILRSHWMWTWNRLKWRWSAAAQKPEKSSKTPGETLSSTMVLTAGFGKGKPLRSAYYFGTWQTNDFWQKQRQRTCVGWISTESGYAWRKRYNRKRSVGSRCHTAKTVLCNWN